ncbi:hypothetical protein ACFVAF_25555 [Streptomyces sp. NPDC057596]|uniref:hypothetical protein n=1 Tax=Streptomyces sp. NPDC057596 TaxID=3346178 RepID=UPI003699A8E0
MTDFRRRLRAAVTHTGPGYDLPAQTETDLRAALANLAERYEQIAAKATTDVGKQRALPISQAARDIRTVLATGQLPAHLRTDEESAS